MYGQYIKMLALTRLRHEKHSSTLKGLVEEELQAFNELIKAFKTKITLIQSIVTFFYKL